MSTVKLNILQCVVGLAIIRSNVLAVACPEVKPPVGGMITSTGQISEGSTVTASCNNGGTMNGPALLTCIGGQWYPREFGTCMENSLNAIPMPTSAASQALGGAQCLPMLAPAGATLTYSSGTMNSGLATVGLQNHGTTVTMMCNNGTPQGATTAICQNGLWMPPILGACLMNSVLLPNTNMISPITDLKCPFGLIAPMNGRITYSSQPPYSVGTTATLICDAGYVAKGNVMSTCQNGIFGVLGTCEKLK